MKSSEMEVNREEHGAATVLRPVGDIDLSRAPALRTHLVSALDGKPDRLVIDLSEVEYMDSSGVATLVEAMQLARSRGVQLVLCALQARVRSILEIARLDMIFTIVDDVEAAMAH